MVQQNCASPSVVPNGPASSSPSSASVKASLANFLQQQQQQNLAAALALNGDTNNNHIGAGSPADRGGSSARTVAYCQGKHPGRANNASRSAQCNNLSALLSPKASPNQFVLGRQPPDYDEATKQLNKARHAQPFASTTVTHASSKPGRSRSVKSKDVDDVLEILIKNGELPPSAAQEPPTPTTPINGGDMGALLACTPPSFPTPPPSSEATTFGERTPPSLALSCDSETPPPSASLDFDFHLDIDDFEGMDLGMLAEGSKQPSRNSFPEPADLADPTLSMEIELSDWLDVMMPNASSSSSSAAPQNAAGSVTAAGTATNAAQHDPLLSTNAEVHDPFDLFPAGDPDFRTWDDFRTSWDSTDFIA